MTANTPLLEQYCLTRSVSEDLCANLKTEDFGVQPIEQVSPPKWHLGHTSWFFETFVLQPHLSDYQLFDDRYNFIFNSYYESVGSRVVRTDRGNLSRPTVEEVYRYRHYVDNAMHVLLTTTTAPAELAALITLGIHHEQQHQELLITDIKYILGHNPLLPASIPLTDPDLTAENNWVSIPEGVYEIGHEPRPEEDVPAFSFDNEHGRHKAYLQNFQIHQRAVSNREYLEFVLAGGYQQFQHWHAEGWDWVRQHQIQSPLYWHHSDNQWLCYTADGLQPLPLDKAVCHVSYYEAAAYAAWKDMRLPTEAEWEVAADHINWGQRWEWTNSAYLPYPGFKKSSGAVGEYNGKFMINQMVLRGASIATAEGHARKSYRNFFHPDERWQFMGIRLAQ
ncbi:ergothioneine biosynthesis protein EgtB [Pseudomaricurvus sp.]|uniref:ergothioneine biosynthesis protein EgtB n=1 Tax=Pseudomaricurvus sp. TaxID=2004510 RepID=UPI003F6C0C11